MRSWKSSFVGNTLEDRGVGGVEEGEEEERRRRKL